MTPGWGSDVRHGHICHYSLSSSIDYSMPGDTQTIYSINIQHQGWGSDVRRGHICHYSLSPCIDYSMPGDTQSICSINMKHIDCYCVKGLWCCLPIPSLIFIYSMMRLFIYKYEPLWQEVGVKSLILRWPVRPVGLLSQFWEQHTFLNIPVPSSSWVLGREFKSFCKCITCNLPSYCWLPSFTFFED